MRRFLSWVACAAIAYLIFSTAAGIEDLNNYMKYFTVLSNLLLGVSEVLYCLTLIDESPEWVTYFKYTCVTLTTLTLVTVLVDIGPRTDFQTAYEGPNYYFHFLVPLLALLEFTLLDEENEITLPATLLPLPPIAAYAAFYIFSLNGEATDWYGFAENGINGAYTAFGWLLFGGWILAVILAFGHECITFTLSLKDDDT